MTSKNFNIKETVNKNIEKHQFPSFTNYRSMVGWCSMNYPKVLINPVYMQKETNAPDSKLYDLNSIFQQRNPTDREKPQFIKPFTNYVQPSKQDLDKSIPPPSYGRGINSKVSSMTLATTKHDVKSRIFEENNRLAEQYSAIRPLASMLGPNKDNDFSRKVRQIGQVYYNPPSEGEQMRHLKKLPNTVVNEQNLISILSPELTYLDLQYKEDISNELINKVGYLAPNIKELNLTHTKIDNNVLIELGKSCRYLEAIDISLCESLEQEAILSFLKDNNRLRKFCANHLTKAITDASLNQLRNCEDLSILSVNYCSQITSAGIQALEGKEFEFLGLANLPNLKGEDFAKLLTASAARLTYLDMSYNPDKEINGALMCKVGICTKLITIILTGCEKIGDEGINNMSYGEKGKPKQPQGFTHLTTLKIGGLISVSDTLYKFLHKCPALTFLQANSLERLSDNFLDQIKTHPSLRTVLLNLTPNITDEKIKEVKQTNKHLNIIRNIVKMTDPADDGLRMPIPLASMKIKKPKKDKKKK